MTTVAENHLLNDLQKIDKEIEEAERALTHLNKQVGSKVSQLNNLKDKRKKTKDALADLRKALQETHEQPVIGLTMREVK